MMSLDKEYWDQHYLQNRTAWDIGYPSPPLVEYVNQIKNKNIKILVPGAGNAWEVEYLWKKGFKNTYLLDISDAAIERFKKRISNFPQEQIIEEDFFNHESQYDLILEQTFLSSLLPEQRKDYVTKMYELLKKEGKLVGLVFNHEFSFNGPPFGGSPDEYINLFKSYFILDVFEVANNSIKPRKGREHFLLAKRKINI